MLRYLRSTYDLIYQIVTCPAFKTLDAITDFDAPDVSCSIQRRAIQGIILNLVALEVSALLKSGQITEPEKYYAELLFSKDVQNLHATNGDLVHETSMALEDPARGKI